MKLFTATPMAGAQCAGIFTDSMCQLYDVFARSGVALQHRFIFNGSVVSRLRTELANEFMASDATHLLFIDADIGFDPMQIPSMLAVERAGFDIVAAPYLKKNIHWDMVVQAAREVERPSELSRRTGNYAVKLVGDEPLDLNSDQPVEAEYIGAGFMLIPRRTFMRFKAAYPDRTYGAGSMVHYFSDEVQEDMHVSEDVFFCRMIRAAGGRVACCPWVRARHFGNHVFG